MKIRDISLLELNQLIWLYAHDKIIFGVWDGDDEFAETCFLVSIAGYTLYADPWLRYFKYVPGLIINDYLLPEDSEKTWKDNPQLKFEDLILEVTSHPLYNQEEVMVIKTEEEAKLVCEAEDKLGLFFFTYNDEKKCHDGGWYPTLNMNDTFAYSTADCENIKFEDIPKLLDLHKKYRHHGIDAWVAVRRGVDVLERYRTPEYFKAKEELNA